ncbi:MAG: T9SS type A sorting domain-containing protein, partial [Flavobacteriales bacterium]|nr:T9SS type A sorting domain-containing protein [Flavobacteriales bacterium]
YISIYQYDIESNQDSLIGTIYEPGVIGIVADAIGFDSNNGILYYAGYTNDPAIALYAIPVRDSSFSFTKTILNAPDPYSSITSLNFDNVNEKLFAANDTYDADANYTGRNIVEIDITTGDVYTLTELSEFAYFVGGSSLFDQNTGTFLLVGITNGGELEMIAFDTYSNTYTTGFVPDNVSEIVCDNSLFAKSRYAVSMVEPQAILNFKLYPNPVSEILNLECASEGPVLVQIFTSLGELVYEKNNTAANNMHVDMSALSPGLYTVTLSGAKQTLAKKLLVE